MIVVGLVELSPGISEMKKDFNLNVLETYYLLHFLLCELNFWKCLETSRPKIFDKFFEKQRKPCSRVK